MDQYDDDLRAEADPSVHCGRREVLFREYDHGARHQHHGPPELLVHDHPPETLRAQHVDDRAVERPRDVHGFHDGHCGPGRDLRDAAGPDENVSEHRRHREGEGRRPGREVQRCERHLHELPGVRRGQYLVDIERRGQHRSERPHHRGELHVEVRAERGGHVRHPDELHLRAGGPVDRQPHGARGGRERHLPRHHALRRRSASDREHQDEHHRQHHPERTDAPGQRGHGGPLRRKRLDGPRLRGKERRDSGLRIRLGLQRRSGDRCHRSDRDVDPSEAGELHDQPDRHRQRRLEIRQRDDDGDRQRHQGSRPGVRHPRPREGLGRDHEPVRTKDDHAECIKDDG